ncbi:TPA: hypothetical protein HA259_06720, partial [Thermoplasmata archaeon]|nr:hypothetical protein [Thermoplasmata archaeon]
VRKQMTAFEITKETVALDVTREVGHGNTFLTHVHTARNFRKEIIQRDMDRARFEATLSRSMVPEAKEIAKRLLKEHQVPRLEDSVVKAGDAVIREHESRLRKSPRA